MSSIGSPAPFFFGGAKSYGIERSLRFNNGDSHKLTRTFGTNTSNTTKTVSFWVKRGNVSSSSHQNIFSTTISGMIEGRLFFLTDDRLQFEERDASGGSSDGRRITTQKFRDVSAWYHVVLVLNSTEGTEIDRAKIYVNGTQVTAFDQTRNISQNYSFSFFRSSVDNFIGVMNGSSEYFDGYLAEINFIDGQALTPASFGETDSTTGQWIPKEYTGTYGNNGFYLNFSDNSSTTAATLGKDSSGNGNNFTPSNFGATNVDAVKDTPSNNFATLNALKKPTNGAISNGNLDGSGNASAWVSFFSTILVSSGKWFCEVKVNATRVGVGIAKDGADENSYLGSAADTYAYYDLNGKWNNNSNSSYGATYTTNDIIGMALDMDAGTLIFYKNGTSQGTAFTGLSGEFALGFSVYGGSANASINYGQDSTFAGATSSGGNTDGNGQGDFKYAVPSGYKALCSANLPDPTIKLPNKHFDTLLWTGTAASHTLTGLNFQPDWFWAKARSVAYHNTLMDSVRGTDRQLWSNRSNDEQTNTSFLTSFNSNGVTLGDNSSGSGATNTNGHTYVGWNWNAGDTDSKTYTVTVVSDSGNKYRFDGFGTSAVTLDLAEGGTYTFNYPSAHPLRFSTTADGTHGGGSEYTTGVSSYGNSVTITIAASAPQLFYFCTQHSGMGGAINTNSTLGSSNFDGSIQTIVKANTTAGFSITKYTGNGSSSATIGHGLGVAPDVIILKNRSSSADWVVMHSSTESYDGGNYKHKPLKLNTTDGLVSILGLWSTPNSSTQSISDGQLSSGNRPMTNTSGDNYVAYFFSEVAGYSKFKSYTGNGNANGTFVYTGFRPAWVLIRNSNAGFNWVLQDSKRSAFNVADKKLNPDSNAVEQSNYDKIDILSNGFKPRVSDAGVNANGSVYYYWAFAESPFKYARAR